MVEPAYGMRRRRWALPVVAALLFTAGCVSNVPLTTAPAVKAVAVPADPNRIHDHVLFLTGIQPPRSHTHVESLDKVAAYVEERFRASGFDPIGERFTVAGKPYRNVIADYGPAGRPKLVIGAHYDVAGENPGADDNASSVGALLELARLVGTLKPALSYQLEFVAFTLEEPPYFATNAMGSAVNAAQLRKREVPLRGMISLEMIGYYSDQPGSQHFPPMLFGAQVPSVGNFVAVVGRSQDRALVAAVAQGMRAGTRMPVEALTASQMLGVGLSDQRNYWDQGYTAVMVTDTSFYRNPNYHKHTDTPDTLDYNRIAEVVRGLYAALISL